MAGPLSAFSKTVMVTGANGFLGSYIVKELLESGHVVHACVRDVNCEASVAHLKDLPGGGTTSSPASASSSSSSLRLKLFSVGDFADATCGTRPFDLPMKNCDAVIHTATPINVKFNNGNDLESEIYQPAMTSTRELLECLIHRNSDTVRYLVLTSSMSSVAPRPEPARKDESHWSDPEDQKARGNWYGATKTCQELLVRETIQSAKSSGALSPEFVYAAICPTMIIGPLLKPPHDCNHLDGTMGCLQRWLRGGRVMVPNDSMSFIHVEDCARMHTKVLEISSANPVCPHLRYMSLIESLHWNDIMKIWKELYLPLPDYHEYQGGDEPLIEPTQFNLEAMKSLGVPFKSTRETMKISIEYLQSIGALKN